MKKAPNKNRSAGEERLERRFFQLLRQGTDSLHAGEGAKAIRFLERARRLNWENVDAALNLGGAYILSRQFTKAVAVLEPLADRAPRNPMVWTNLGAAYLGNPVLARDEDQQRAIAAFERAIGLDPVVPHVAYNLGLIYRDRDETDKALHWFRRAVQANPNDRDARSYVARLTEGKHDRDRGAPPQPMSAPSSDSR